MPSAPNSSPPASWLGSRTSRAFLFWLCMVLLAITLWKMSSTPSPKGRELSYSEFLSQVEKQNVRDVTLHLRENTAVVTGVLPSTGERFHTVIPKETVPDLNSQLRKQGVNIEVREGSERTDWRSMLLNFLPLVLLVVFWIFMMRRLQRRSRPE